MVKLKLFLSMFLGILMALPFVLPVGWMIYNVVLNLWCLPSPIAIAVAIISVLVSIVCGIRTWMKSKFYQELKNENAGGK